MVNIFNYHISYINLQKGNGFSVDFLWFET